MSDLERFTAAQAVNYNAAAAELRAGRKTTHWMWYVFPQMRGLGSSDMAKRFGIDSLDEAKAYLAHDILGPRLRDGTALVLSHPHKTLFEIFSKPDDRKFVSCMTLFDLAAGGGDNVFASALNVFSQGKRDEKTLALLA